MHVQIEACLLLVCSVVQVLKPFLDSGQLDMAIFDAVNDATIRLSRSGVVLGSGTCVNPICIVANYLFDTLCHDIFQVHRSTDSTAPYRCLLRFKKLGRCSYGTVMQYP